MRGHEVPFLKTLMEMTNPYTLRYRFRVARVLNYMETGHVESDRTGKTCIFYFWTGMTNAYDGQMPY